MNSVMLEYMEIGKHLLEDSKPSIYLNEVYDGHVFRQYPFIMLYQLRFTEQSPQHHPEGNVWNHTLMVVDEAAKMKHKSKNIRAFMWAALLHDIGKPDTTRKRKGKITAYDHDKVGAVLSGDFLSFFDEDKEFISLVCGLVRYHMQILFVVKGLPFADIKGMREDTDVPEIALLGLCDRLGRTGSDRRTEENHVDYFLKCCGLKSRGRGF